jgi:hypothetical protein
VPNFTGTRKKVIVKVESTTFHVDAVPVHAVYVDHYRETHKRYTGDGSTIPEGG